MPAYISREISEIFGSNSAGYEHGNGILRKRIIKKEQHMKTVVTSVSTHWETLPKINGALSKFAIRNSC